MFTAAGKRASLLVNHGLTVVLFGILKQVGGQEMSLSEDVLITLHCLMAKIGHKGTGIGYLSDLVHSVRWWFDVLKQVKSLYVVGLDVLKMSLSKDVITIILQRCSTTI